jgi:hypothetical protein
MRLLFNFLRCFECETRPSGCNERPHYTILSDQYVDKNNCTERVCVVDASGWPQPCATLISRCQAKYRSDTQRASRLYCGQSDAADSTRRAPDFLTWGLIADGRSFESLRLLRQAHAPEQLLKSWVGMKRFEAWIDFDSGCSVKALLTSLL